MHNYRLCKKIFYNREFKKPNRMTVLSKDEISGLYFIQATVTGASYKQLISERFFPEAVR